MDEVRLRVGIPFLFVLSNVYYPKFNIRFGLSEWVNCECRAVYGIITDVSFLNKYWKVNNKVDPRKAKKWARLLVL